MFSSIFYCQGWNKNWDEWVPETRIMKQVAENFDKQKKLLATHMAQNKAKKQKLKTEKAVKKSKGGSDSGSNSRASTPVGDSRQSAALGSSSTGGGSGASGGGAGTPGGRQQPGSKRSGGAAPAQDPDTDPVAATPTVSTPAAAARDSEPETSTPASTAASTPAQVTKETGASTRKKAKKEETVEESVDSILSGERH